MDNVIPFPQDRVIRPAGQAAPAGPSPWVALGLIAVALVGYEALSYAAGESRRAHGRRRR